MLDPLPEAGRRAPLKVVGVGNAWRGDDRAGLEVARRLRAAGVDARECEGDCARLVDELAPGDDVVVVDAAASGAPAGAVLRLGPEQLPHAALRSSTHAFGVAEAVELARVLGRQPRRLRVYAIEGADFGAGDRLTPAVERAVGEVVDELR